MLLAAFSSAAFSQQVPTVVPAALSEQRTQLQVGTARVDVTPPPGPSMFGHGPDGRVSNGYWTRLYCRVFVLQTSAADRHAIIPCDLPAISDNLHRVVADKTRAYLPASRLMLTATHTHAGPAHYFESPAYGGIFSTRQPGYDPRMVEFLAARIAHGVSLAVDDLRPAAARWIHTSAWKISRNRSLVAFNANPPSTFKPRTAPAPDLPQDLAAVDPALDVLQIEEVDRAESPHRLGPIGWLVFFGMHPTVLPASNRLFGADLDGVASRRVEARLRRSWAGKEMSCGKRHEPLAAFVNTNEGDLVPTWRRGDVDEAIEIGNKLADVAIDTLNESVGVSNHSAENTFRTDFAPESRYLEIELPGHALPRGPGNLCNEGRLGQAGGRGGSDHPVSIDGLIDSGPDLDLKSSDCHAPKAALLGAFSAILAGVSAKDLFPRQVAFALVHFGDTWLSFVPAELTVHAGAAVNTAVLNIVQNARDLHRDSQATAIVAGLANSYIQYVATGAEYAFQAYEGASTLYGPRSAEFFAQVIEELALDLVGVSQPDSRRMGQSINADYMFAPRQDRLPIRSEPPREARFRPLSLCTIAEMMPPALCFRWTHAEPGQVPLTTAPWVELISAEGQSAAALPDGVRCDSATLIDDQGVDFQTRVRERIKDGTDGLVWSTVFRPSAEEWTALKGDPLTYRLRARGGDGLPAVASPSFSFQSLPRHCTPAQVQYCLGLERNWQQ